MKSGYIYRRFAHPGMYTIRMVFLDIVCLLREIDINMIHYGSCYME